MAAARRDTDRATRLGGAAEALRQQISITITPVDSAHHDRYVLEMRSQMDPREFTNAWETGLAAAVDEVVESSLATG